MKWIVAFSVLIAVVAVAALAAVLKIGVALPPKLEDMTVEADVLQITNVNLHILLSNQTLREISIDAVVDGSIAFGGSLIRDQHFGTASLSTRAEPGVHSLDVMVCGSLPATNTFRFTTMPMMTNYIFINVWSDKQTRYRFEMKQSNKPFG
jgi:hypothetical protein